MLARTYKTATKLGITQWEYDGLLAFIEAAPTMKHWHGSYVEGLSFNMNNSCSQHRCGTVCCIGGFVGIHHELHKVHDYVHSRYYDPVLCPLYFPPTILNWNSITPTHAAQVVDHFLQTGEVKW